MMRVERIVWIGRAVAGGAGTLHVDEPSRFIPVVGNWVIAQDANKNVLMVDGRQWKKGQPAGGLAEKARLIYGSPHEQFIDNLQPFPYYSYARGQRGQDFPGGLTALSLPSC